MTPTGTTGDPLPAQPESSVPARGTTLLMALQALRATTVVSR
jgi:hypothetical protein